MPPDYPRHLGTRKDPGTETADGADPCGTGFETRLISINNPAAQPG
jgi:hypothetical protein